MKRKIGLLSLTGTGVASIIGSGWLFASYHTAKAAGSGSILAWVIGACVALLLALTLAEISTLHPKRGLFTRLLTLSHNRDMGYITALVNWLGMVAVIPTEAMATVQYLSHIRPDWQPIFYTSGSLTTLGLILVSALVIVYAILNFWGVKSLVKTNNILTLFKVIVPIATAVIILITAFNSANFSVKPIPNNPIHLSDIFAAIMAGGIIYAFNGFQTIVSFCAEAKTPEKNIPRALLISIFLCLGIYLLLQIAFIAGFPNDMLANGWGQLLMQSPIVQLTALLNLHFLSLVLYVDACISPSGTGIVYAGSTSRMLTAMSQDRQAPRFFSELHPVHDFSRRSLLFNIALCLSLLWFFPSWGALVVIVSLFHVISYMACPISLMRLRIVEAKKPRKFRLPFAPILCPLLFLVVTFLFCLTRESDLVLVSSVIVVFYCTYIVVSNRGQWKEMKEAIRRSYKLVLYLVTLTLLGLLSNPLEGGYDLISHTSSYVLMTITSLGFYVWMVYFEPRKKLGTMATRKS